MRQRRRLHPTDAEQLAPFAAEITKAAANHDDVTQVAVDEAAIDEAAQLPCDSLPALPAGIRVEQVQWFLKCQSRGGARF